MSSAPQIDFPGGQPGPPVGARAGLAGPGRRGGAFRLTLAALALPLVLGLGCSGLKPEDPTTPVDPNSPCAQPLEVFLPLNNGLTRIGTEQTLDIATWNLEFFPLVLPGDYNCNHANDPARVAVVANLVNTLGLDIIACEEVSDTTGFRQLVAACPGYSGIKAPEPDRGCNYQREAFIYRTDEVVVHKVSSLFQSNSSAFPRPPLQLDVTITSNGRSYDLSLIALHLKASGGSENVARRREASAALRTYINQQEALNPDQNFMVLGDWNDVLNAPTSSNSFLDLLNDPNEFKFLTAALVGRTDLASYPPRSLIDHILVNKAACPDFVGARITTLQLDLVTTNYSLVSDHRPVFVQAPIFQ